MLRNTCEINVGRLMEIRAAAGYRSVDDVDHMIAMMGALTRSLKPGVKYVIAADWRAVSVMSPETALRAREMLALSNPRVIRSSILTLPNQGTAKLQVVRLVREAESASRRHFADPREQCTWLAQVLAPEEQARARHFLGLEA